MALARALVGVEVLEALDNYSRIEVPSTRGPGPDRNETFIVDDEDFWKDALEHRDAVFGKTYRFDCASVSSWVSRVPGLYWTAEGKRFREAQPVRSERIDRWNAFPPLGKSVKVMGGIGTVRMSPSIDGYILGTLTTSRNVSAGVPIIVPQDLWRTAKEGSVVNGLRVSWEAMPSTWSAQFRSTKGIPKGCLVLKGVPRFGEPAPLLLHPFSIMEYVEQDAKLYDFVFATADTAQTKWQDDISEFFAAYRNAGGRHGSYLTHADHVSHLWDARFEDPDQLRMIEAAASSHLEILQARVRDAMLGPAVVESLVRVLAKQTLPELERLGCDADLDVQSWLRNGTVRDEAANLVSLAIERGQFETLLQTIRIEMPHAFG